MARTRVRCFSLSTSEGREREALSHCRLTHGVFFWHAQLGTKLEAPVSGLIRGRNQSRIVLPFLLSISRLRR